MSLRVVQLELAAANALVAALHRHHKPVQGHRFSIGATEGGRLVGAAICGRPVARNADQARVIEVTRLVTDGTPNACSLLYGAAARAARELGYAKAQTFVLAEEPGTSLKAAGWRFEAWSAGGQWEHTDGKARRTDQPTGPKQRWARALRGAEARAACGCWEVRDEDGSLLAGGPCVEHRPAAPVPVQRSLLELAA